MHDESPRRHSYATLGMLFGCAIGGGGSAPRARDHQQQRSARPRQRPTLLRHQVRSLAFAQAPAEAFAGYVVRAEIEAMELTLGEDWGALEAHLVESYRTPPS